MVTMVFVASVYAEPAMITLVGPVFAWCLASCCCGVSRPCPERSGGMELGGMRREILVERIELRSQIAGLLPSRKGGGRFDFTAKP